MTRTGTTVAFRVAVAVAILITLAVPARRNQAAVGVAKAALGRAPWPDVRFLDDTDPLRVRALALLGKGDEVKTAFALAGDWPPSRLDMRMLAGAALSRECRSEDVMTLIEAPGSCSGDLVVRIAQELDRNCPELGERAYGAAYEECRDVPAGVRALRLKSDWYYRHGRLDDAISTVRLLIARRRDNAEAWAELARLHYEKGDFAAAVAVADEALAVAGGKNAGARAIRAICHLEFGEPEIAIPELERVLTEEVHPSPYVRLQLARAYRMVGDERRAAEMTKQANAIAPGLVLR